MKGPSVLDKKWKYVVTIVSAVASNDVSSGIGMGVSLFSGNKLER